MQTRPIVIDDCLTTVTPDLICDRRPTLDVRGGDVLPSILEDVASPVGVVTANRFWSDDYLDALAPGDWVTTIGSGYENFPLEALEDRDVALTHTPGVSAPQVAEHVFAMACSFTRRLDDLRARMRDHEWDRPEGGMTDLAGDTCCVVGIGRIGETIAERASAFGMTVRGVKRTVEGYDGVADAVYAPEDVGDALDGARLAVLAVPLTDATRRMIGRKELERTTEDAIVVNVSRGPVLDADALVEALEEDVVAAACLDVTDPEPLPASSPLWDREDALVTPHCAGMSDKYAERFLDRYLAQYDRWRAGDPLRDRIA